jgi:HprK-related kinase B
MRELTEIKDALVSGVTFQSTALALNLGRCTIRVLCNSSDLLSRLNDYFSHIVLPDYSSECDIEILAIEQESVELPVHFKDWHREPGKTGRKDAFYDLNGGRIIRKVRTGMVFLQSEAYRIAIGPCVENDNQVINFINNQYMTWLQQRDWLNCHAAALVKDDKAYAVAGFSGGGKSTLMLHMLENDETHFLSNDRLFIQADNEQLLAAGVAKMPRINPGTITHNPRLENMIPLAERERLLSLPAQDLWDLEQKYDVDIDAVFGHGRIVSEAPLQSFLVLNWQRDADEPLGLKKVNLRDRPDLLQAIMKSAGPFYQQSNGEFSIDRYEFDHELYLKALELVDVFEATGKVDFELLAQHYLAQDEL